jgi:DNA-binding MarR family transcriptional regulator
MDFDKTLNYLIADLTAIHRNQLEKNLLKYSLHSGQIFILFELWKTDGQSQINLAKNLNLSAPTINKLVKGLISGNFVEARRSVIDTRIVEVYLTKKGLEIKPEIEKLWAELESEITTNLTDTEKLIFMQILEKVLLSFYNS